MMGKWRKWVRDSIVSLRRTAHEYNMRLVALETAIDAMPDLPQTVDQHEEGHRQIAERLAVLESCERGIDAVHRETQRNSRDIQRLMGGTVEGFDSSPESARAKATTASTVPTREQMSLTAGIIAAEGSLDGLFPDQVNACRAVLAWLRAGAPQAPEPRSWDAGLAECERRGLMCSFNSFPGVWYRAWLYLGKDVVATRYGPSATEALWAALDAQAEGGLISWQTICR